MKAALTAQETDQIPLVLLAINHSDLAAPIRVVNNGANITSNGVLFVAFPFEVTLPDDEESTLATVTLTIDNVDRTIVTAVRSMSNDELATCEMDVILAATPNTVEAGPFNFSIKQISYDASKVTAEMAFEDILNEIYPKDDFNPNDYPGMY